MKTLLVPTDFSETSKNAINYSFGFAKQVGITKIVLYNTYTAQLNVSSDLITPTGVTIDYAAEQDYAENQLFEFKETFKDQVPEGVELLILANYGSLTSRINEGVKEAEADAILLGITGGGVLTEKFIGSNATTIARDANVPVFIVPPSASHDYIHRILLASDFVDVELSTPFGPIIDIVNDTNSQLYILHVAEKPKDQIDINHPEAISFLNWLPGIQPEFHFIQSNDFPDAINTFAVEKNIGLVIIIPKKHDLVEKIFVENHTKKLAFNTTIPIMAINNN